jgi:shikimate dehydrogenase
MIKRLGVLGWPVAHSRSPAMQNAALRELGLSDWHYQRLPVPPELFDETTRGLGKAGFVGANVTIPHKHAALALADAASATAREIGAANTLSIAPDGAISAENTDAPGLIAALPASPRGMRALVLGAGGSARAAVWALREAGASDVAVWNRTPERARKLAREFGVRAVATPSSADLLVNCTAVGLEVHGAPAGGPVPTGHAGFDSLGPKTPKSSGKVERSATEDCALNQLGLTFDLLGEYSYVADLVYRSGSTPLLAAASELGAQTVDGLEILIAQGALSFKLWTGRESPLEVMRAAART